MPRLQRPRPISSAINQAPIVPDQQNGSWNIPIVNRLLNNGIQQSKPVGWGRALSLRRGERRSADEKQHRSREDREPPSRWRVWTGKKDIPTLHNRRKSLNKLKQRLPTTPRLVLRLYPSPA